MTDSFFGSGNSGDPGNVGVPPALVDEGGGIYSYTFTSLGAFTAAGADKLVLGFQNKDFGAVAGPAVTEVTYDGVALSEAIQANSLRQRNSIFYLDNVATDGDLVVRFTDGPTSNQASYVFGLYALDNTLPGVGDTVTATHLSPDSLAAGGPSVNVPATSPTAFVLNLWARNNGNLELTGPAGFTEDVDLSVPTDGGALASVFASGIFPGPGSYNTVVSGLGGSTPAATMVGAAFESVPAASPIPEPSTVALILLGLCGLGLHRLRRR